MGKNKSQKYFYPLHVPPTLLRYLRKAVARTGQTQGSIITDNLAFGLGVASRDALIRRLAVKRAIADPVTHDADVLQLEKEDREAIEAAFDSRRRKRGGEKNGSTEPPSISRK